jgi:hypothetical protein
MIEVQRKVWQVVKFPHNFTGELKYDSLMLSFDKYCKDNLFPAIGTAKQAMMEIVERLNLPKSPSSKEDLVMIEGPEIIYWQEEFITKSIKNTIFN